MAKENAFLYGLGGLALGVAAALGLPKIALGAPAELARIVNSIKILNPEGSPVNDLNFVLTGKSIFGFDSPNSRKPVYMYNMRRPSRISGFTSQGILNIFKTPTGWRFELNRNWGMIVIFPGEVEVDLSYELANWCSGVIEGGVTTLGYARLF